MFPQPQAVSNYTDVNSSPDDKKKRLFLSDFSLNTDNERLREFFSRFGKVKDCHVMLDEKGRSRCCAFLNYEDVSSVDECMRWRPHVMDSQIIITKRAMPYDDPNESEAYLTVKRVFIGGLRNDINKTKLQEYFSRFGNIRQILCIRNAFGQPRGFAFISFDDYDAADKAILEQSHFINGRRLNVRKAIPGERLERLSISYENKSGSSSNRNNVGHINDTNLNDQVQHPSSNNNSGHTSDNNWDNQLRHPSNNNDYRHINDKNWDNQMRHPSNNYNSEQNIDTNWNTQVQPRSNNNNSGHINDKNSDNQLRYPSYNQRGYNSNGSKMTGGFSSSYNSIRQNQPPSIIQSMRDRNSYDAYQDTPFNSYGNQSSISNSMPPSYEKNRQQNYDVIPNDFGGMNNHFNQPEIHKNGEGSNSSFLSNSFDDSNSYGATSHNYNEMPRQQSRRAGQIGRGRGRGGGPFRSNKLSNYANRSAPYPTRGRSSNYKNGSEPYPTRDSSSNYLSHGRDQLNKK